MLGSGAMLDGNPLEKHMGRKKVVPAFDALSTSYRGQFIPRQPVNGQKPWALS